MENSELKRPSKKVRLVLTGLAVTVVSALGPAGVIWTSSVIWTS